MNFLPSVLKPHCNPKLPPPSLSNPKLSDNHNTNTTPHTTNQSLHNHNNTTSTSTSHINDDRSSPNAQHSRASQMQPFPAHPSLDNLPTPLFPCTKPIHRLLHILSPTHLSAQIPLNRKHPRLTTPPVSYTSITRTVLPQTTTPMLYAKINNRY